MKRSVSALLTGMALAIGLAQLASGSECSCRAPRGPETAGLEFWPGMFLTKERAYCNGTRPDKCEFAPWARANVPLCVIGDVEVLLPSDPRPPVLLNGTDDSGRQHWDWMGKRLNLWYRNHSCQYVNGALSYLGNQHDCHESIAHYTGDPQHDLIGEYSGPVKAAVLDYGADPSGQQFQVLSSFFDGPLVGWNVREPHETIKPTHYINATDIGNFTLVFGERDSCLPFQDDSFDFVWSLNVLEHVTPMRPYLEEIHRVLKPGGLFWGKYNPHWFSARGHHIHKDMVEQWSKWFLREGHTECADVPFETDGQTMPDWGHLYMTQDELREHLRKTPLGKCERMVEQFIHWLWYDDLVFSTNKMHYQEVLAMMEDVGMERIHLWLMDHYADSKLPWDAARRIGEKYGHGDILFNDAEFLYAKPLHPNTHAGHHKTGVTWIDDAATRDNVTHKGVDGNEPATHKEAGSNYHSATLRLRVHNRKHG